MFGGALERDSYGNVFSPKWKEKKRQLRRYTYTICRFYHSLHLLCGSAYCAFQEYIVMALAVHGSLHDHIHQKKYKPIV